MKLVLLLLFLSLYVLDQCFPSFKSCQYVKGVRAAALWGINSSEPSFSLPYTGLSGWEAEEGACWTGLGSGAAVLAPRACLFTQTCSPKLAAVIDATDT